MVSDPSLYCSTWQKKTVSTKNPERLNSRPLQQRVSTEISLRRGKIASEPGLLLAGVPIERVSILLCWVLWDGKRHRLVSSVVRQRGCTGCSCACQSEKNPARMRLPF